MSIAAIQWAWARQGCSPGAKLLLLALADHCNGTTNGCECWPSLDRLMDLTGLSRSSVCKYTNELERLGHIRRNRSSGRTSTVYNLMVQQSATRTVEDVQQSATRTPTVRHTDSNSPPHGLEAVIEPGKNQKTERGAKQNESPRASRLSLSALPHDWMTWASTERPELLGRLPMIWEHFRDYWLSQPNGSGMKADWFATWRNWIRRERERGTDYDPKTIAPVTDARADFGADTPIEDLPWMH